MASTKNEKNEKEVQQETKPDDSTDFRRENKIKEVGYLSQATLKMILQIIHKFKATVHQKHVERITNPQRRKISEKNKKKKNKLIHKHIRICSTKSNFME